MEVKVTADSIRYLVDAGMADQVASEITRLEKENRRLRIIAGNLRHMVCGDNFWTIELEAIVGSPAPKK